jgi:hypothetical protein
MSIRTPSIRVARFHFAIRHPFDETRGERHVRPARSNKRAPAALYFNISKTNHVPFPAGCKYLGRFRQFTHA